METAVECVFLEEYCLFSCFIKTKDANNAYSSKNTTCFAWKKGGARQGCHPKIGVFFCGVTPGVTPVVTLAFQSEFVEFFTPKGNP